MSVQSPLIAGGPYPVTQGFGCTPYTDEIPDNACPSGYFHSGIDIGVECGTTVYSGWPAAVVAVGSPAFGYPSCCASGCLGPHAVALNFQSPANGPVTVWYGHLQMALVSVGEQVVPGQPIGHTGTMGCSTGCHLHLEVDPQGQGPGTLNALDPTPYLLGEVSVSPPSPSPPSSPCDGCPEYQPTSSPGGNELVPLVALGIGGALVFAGYERGRRRLR